MFGSYSKKLKETEIRDEFLYNIFRDALGYITVSQNPNAYSFKKEQLVQVDGTFADAGFGANCEVSLKHIIIKIENTTVV